MLALSVASQEKDGFPPGGGKQPSVIHIRQREGQQSWLSVRLWELTPHFGNCLVHAVRSLVPDLVCKELGAWFVPCALGPGLFVACVRAALATRAPRPLTLTPKELGACFVPVSALFCVCVRALATQHPPTHHLSRGRPHPPTDFLALWEGCFFSEPPAAQMVDVHRFAAFFDLPMEMIRFFFCEGVCV